MSSDIFKSPRVQMLYNNLEPENIASYSYQLAWIMLL